ncbi:MAG: uroporphyrinogen-III synthase [Gammaproteobacteria bacterium]|nr:uroporphyrinogen-III synthase [Gammaproteobacteria bacterium]MCW8839558.1 uroporphyrinogen-III synthase [Gammaproteobacteria bacterium]MCW8957491.1 uroporphyrinogen-III synthase [Gammaproteobacteria bacterium]MCW8971993.1 uroporphyrinogen-III synthase [Gammaproteobacteria bacterium]MCW8991966.1 uroporphyrinogen-III synthase [Gammaproteobacteria bacterium]
MTVNNKLHGLGVLVTRPAHQAGPLCERIIEAGGRAIRFPLLQIHDNSHTADVRQRLQQLASYHILIFVSPNAVHYGLDAIERYGGVPAGLQLAAVGRGTARALSERIGRGPELVPTHQFDSEGLLALPGLQQVEGKGILIIRGNGGRALMGETLRERGARVDYAEVYRREIPGPLVAEPNWLAKTDIITVTSSEALENLLNLTDEAQHPALLAKPLVVVSERAAARARELGFRLPARVTLHASDEAIMEAVSNWAADLPRVERNQ